MRAQLGPPNTSKPAVAAVIAGDLDKNATTAAPGELVSIFGGALNKVSASLNGWQGSLLPNALNGTSVTVGGKSALLLFVSPNQINAQVPLDLAAGPQLVAVTSAALANSAFNLTVAPVAPAIFYQPGTAALKNIDYSLISAGNHAKTGDVILVYCTGLGLSTPAFGTGASVPRSPVTFTATPVTAQIGGKAATVVYAIASPGFAGLYQVALIVPDGVSGNPHIVLVARGRSSRTPRPSRYASPAPPAFASARPPAPVSRAQNVRYGVVAFMAGIFVEWPP